VTAWLPLYARLPARLTEALAILPWFAPAVALGALIDRYGWRACLGWTAGGLVLGLVLFRLVG
jgi:hypothetical protein